MKRLYKALSVFFSLATMFIATSCFDADYLVYDTSYCGIYFTKDTLNYSFSVTPLEVTAYEYKIPVKIMGGLSKEEREIAYEVIEDSTTAQAGVQYNFGKAVIEPDSIEGYIPVTILRGGLKGDYANGYEYYKLSIRLVENANFTPTLDSLNQARTLTFTNEIVEPEWLNADNVKVWRPGNPHSNFGSWHPFTYLKVVEYFKKIKDVIPETYKKMVAYYGGENLEKIPYGDLYPYRAIMQKYVCAPLYEYLNDPANREMILEMYPNYPFDFPNPYE
ncbi:MAG: DUF4843 domain-containing protein [Bacteroidaceae bacterium]|nr:DUF4843 domain-containing protein [Bacteroidaceae bacterium]